MSTGAAAWIPLFPDEEIPHILDAICRCGAQLNKRHSTELENDLSDRLRLLLDRDPQLRDRPVELFREVPIYERKRARTKQLGRSDLMFIFSTGAMKPWPYFVVESKRLHVTFESGWQSLISEYVSGGQGMMCFVSQRYSKDLACGGMLGYVFDGDIAAARSAVAAAIQHNRQRLKCSPGLVFRRSALSNGTYEISESFHKRSSTTFTIYHVLIGV